MKNYQNKINDAIDNISRTIGNVDKAKPLGGGNNSEIYQINLEAGKKYILKFYRQGEKDKKNYRQIREYHFLKRASVQKANKSPKVIAICWEHGWTLVSHIEGSSPSRIDSNHVEAFASFIKNINELETQNLKENSARLNAAEALRSTASSITNTRDKLFKIISQTKRNLAANWATHLISRYMMRKLDRIESKNSIELKAVDQYIKNTNFIYSPSDVGIHNMIVTPDKDVYFIDFEHSGYDSPLKIICDWLLTPSNRSEQRLKTLSIELFSESLSLDSRELKNAINKYILLHSIYWMAIILGLYLRKGKKIKIGINVILHWIRIEKLQRLRR